MGDRGILRLTVMSYASAASPGVRQPTYAKNFHAAHDSEPVHLDLPSFDITLGERLFLYAVNACSALFHQPIFDRGIAGRVGRWSASRLLLLPNYIMYDQLASMRASATFLLASCSTRSRSGLSGGLRSVNFKWPIR